MVSSTSGFRLEIRQIKVGFTIIIGILLAIPLSMLVMGAIHLNDCSAERMIPIYLIVSGCFGTVKTLQSFIQRCRKTEEQREEDQTKVIIIGAVVNFFMGAWFITGCVYIYRTRNRFQSEDSNQDNYCDKNLYWFAFWITTSVYIIMAASSLCAFCLGCLTSIFGGTVSTT